MLSVEVRELRRGPVETDGIVQPDDPLFEGLGIELVGPLAVHGRLQATGSDEYFWRGRLTGRVRLECRRCLVEITHAVEAEVSALFSADPDAADDPSVYPLAPSAPEVDVSAAVREELALAVPAYALCREECAGLCPTCGADLNAGPCRCASAAEHS
ncbi:MAG TPA: DUF177 domain-containing protein [Gemmatimonadales bacterium]|nr:DUF177 domain-containing protein [Gemmatimonadales bacterium]